MQSLDTMGKLKETNGYVRYTLEKLPGIRADLFRLDKDRQEWKFGQFAEALRQWTERNHPHSKYLKFTSDFVFQSSLNP